MSIMLAERRSFARFDLMFETFVLEVQFFMVIFVILTEVYVGHL